jgi:hypothetical protein
MFKGELDFKEAYEASENPVLRERSQWTEYMIQEAQESWNDFCLPICLRMIC